LAARNCMVAEDLTVKIGGKWLAVHSAMLYVLRNNSYLYAFNYMVVYKLWVFCSDQKFIMVARTSNVFWMLKLYKFRRNCLED
jgi:hypothetical protein